MKKKSKFFVLLVLVLAYLFLFTSNEDSLKDNYYQVINKDVLKNNEIEDGEYSWSYFLEAQEKVDADTSLVVEEILSGKTNILNDKEITTIKGFYNKALDTNKRNKDGIRDLESYLNRIWKVATIEELVDIIIVVETELGVDLLANIEIVQDYKDNSKNIIYFYPITYAFGSNSDYMVNDDYMTYKAYIRRACVQLWKVYGYEAKEAREVVNRVFSFYENVSNQSKLSDELANISDYYQVVLEEDINSLFSNVNGDYLSRRGIENRNVYSLVDKGQYQYLNDSLTLDNLEVWKEVIITKILSSYAAYGSSDYVEVIDNLNEALLGSIEDKTNEEKAEDMVKGLFISEVDKVYEDDYLDQKQFTEIEEMFFRIKKEYAKRLKNNEWLSKEAKEKALEKLDRMEIIIGLGDVSGYQLADSLEISDSSLISDVIKIQQIVMKDDLQRLDSGDKRNLVQQTQVNAYYQPLDNSIVIPVAFFELMDSDADYYEKLGTLGMIIAHEVTHAFDGNGSQFDENGNLNNWWSEDDKDNFKELKQEVIQYYSQYEVLDGKYINGEKTVNENIADLGAIACIVEVAKARDAGTAEFEAMFSAFAGIWASKERDEYMDLLLLQDVHAPNQFRVNAVLSSTKEFYDVYNIYPWDKMWIPKDERIVVW